MNANTLTMKRIVVALGLLVAIGSPAWAVRLLKQSTAYNATVFMADSSDHVTGKTGLTLTITASKDGAAFASISPTVTELATGWYKLALTTSHTDTAGDLALHITGTGADASDLLLQVRPQVLGDALYQPNVWYVDDGGSDSNNGRSWSSPFLTQSAAQSAASAGDTIHVGPGTYSGAVTFSKDGIKWIGTDETSCIFTHNSGITATLNADDLTFKGLTFTASAETGNGQAMSNSANGIHNLTIEDCTFNGKFDGLILGSVPGVTLKRVECNGTFDGLNYTGCKLTAENCVFTTDSSWSGDVDTHAAVSNELSTADSSTSTLAVFNNCQFVNTRSGTTASTRYTAAIASNGFTRLIGCRCRARATNASYTGNVIAIMCDTRLTNSFIASGAIQVDGGYQTFTTAGSGTAKRVQATVATAVCFIDKSNWTSSDLNGNVYEPRVDSTAVSGDRTAADNLELAGDGTGYNLGSGSIVAASVTAPVTAGTVSDKTGYALATAPPTANENRDAVLGATLSSFNTSGTVGQAINWMKAAFTTSGVYSTPALANAPSGGGGGATVDADIIDDTRTWFAEGYQASNVVEVLEDFEGTLALKPKLNAGTRIASVSTVTCTHAGVTPDNFTVDRSGTIAHADFADLDTAGTYEVVWTVTTVDSQTIPTKCVLIVR